MKVAIEVKDRAEGDRVKVALAHETTRAVLIVMGALLPLPTQAQKDVLHFVGTQLDPYVPLPEAP
jgi:hypothetical protein